MVADSSKILLILDDGPALRGTLSNKSIWSERSVMTTIQIAESVIFHARYTNETRNVSLLHLGLTRSSSEPDVWHLPTSWSFCEQDTSRCSIATLFSVFWLSEGLLLLLLTDRLNTDTKWTETLLLAARYNQVEVKLKRPESLWPTTYIFVAIIYSSHHSGLLNYSFGHHFPASLVKVRALPIMIEKLRSAVFLEALMETRSTWSEL